MKNLIKAIILLFIIIIGKNTKAQVCEFDTLGPTQTKAHKIIELNDKSLIIAGKKGVGGQDQVFMIFAQTIFIKKIDSCNNLIWSITIDSIFANSDRFDILGLSSVNDTITLSWKLYINNQFIYNESKINENGNLISNLKIDSFNINMYSIWWYLKIKDNRYMFFNDQQSDSINFFVIDTNQTIIGYSKVGFYRFAPNVIDFKRTNINTISILLKYGYGDSAYKILNLDTLANFFDTVQINFIDSFPLVLKFNNTNTGLYGLSNSYRKPFLLKLDMLGNKIKKVKLPDYNLVTSEDEPKILKILNNGLVFSCGKNTFVSDSNLVLLIKDSIGQRDNNGGKAILLQDAILSSSKQLYQVGWLWGKSSSGVFPNSNEWIKKSSIFKYIKTINIAGIGTINTKGGFTQLIANVTPTDATNKQVIWSINDTNLATITQTGLLTAKANGTVIITTKTIDGSNLTATKTIIISNQTVGINEVNLTNQITVYPNPASNTLTILTTNNITPDLSGLQLQLLDITGKIITQFNNQTEIDLSNIANGVYMLQIQTNNGNLVKRVVIKK